MQTLRFAQIFFFLACAFELTFAATDTVFSSFENPEASNFSTPLIWGICFIFACVVTITSGMVIYLKFSGTRNYATFQDDLTEAEKKSLNDIITFIEGKIASKTTTIHDCEINTTISPIDINKVLKKGTGRNFKEYLTHARLEITKERLRSSRTSIDFIAESTGFSSPIELRKGFKKYYRISPEDFREKNHIG